MLKICPDLRKIKEMGVLGGLALFERTLLIFRKENWSEREVHLTQKQRAEGNHETDRQTDRRNETKRNAMGKQYLKLVTDGALRPLADTSRSGGLIRPNVKRGT